MTTPEAAERYLQEHLAEWNGIPIAVHNPHDKPVAELPVIYGFNNGGSAGWYHAQLISEDGMGLGAHICSAEGYMYSDLGILEGSAPGRHEDFRKHYPDGYRMAFVSFAEVEKHPGLTEACRLNQLKAKKAEEAKALEKEE